MLGSGVPEQLIEPLPEIGAEENELDDDPEVHRLKGEVEKAKAKVDLYLLSLDRKRIHEGRFYDPVEGTMTPLEAAAVIYRFAHALEHSPSECTPFRRASELKDPPSTIRTALKVLYIARHDQEGQRQLLRNSIVHLDYFQPDEIIDRILEEPDPHRSKDYRVLIYSLANPVSTDAADWKEFTARIDRQMEELFEETAA
jgi:hypothetical protein